MVNSIRCIVVALAIASTVGLVLANQAANDQNNGQLQEKSELKEKDCSGKTKSLKKCKKCCGKQWKDFAYEFDEQGMPTCSCNEDFKNLQDYKDSTSDEMCRVFKSSASNCQDCCSHWLMVSTFDGNSCQCLPHPNSFMCADYKETEAECGECCASSEMGYRYSAATKTCTCEGQLAYQDEVVEEGGGLGDVVTGFAVGALAGEFGDFGSLLPGGTTDDAEEAASDEDESYDFEDE